MKEAAIKLGISEQALYKRLSLDNFKDNFCNKVGGKTIITQEGFEFLSSVVKKRKKLKKTEKIVTSINLSNIKKVTNSTHPRIYEANEVDLILILKSQIDFLKSQIEQQNINFQEQLKIQSENYQENLKIQLEAIKSKENIILNMQELLKSEQETTREVLNYDERSKEIDKKLLQLKQDMVERKSKNKKGFFKIFKFKT